MRLMRSVASISRRRLPLEGAQRGVDARSGPRRRAGGAGSSGVGGHDDHLLGAGRERLRDAAAPGRARRR